MVDKIFLIDFKLKTNFKKTTLFVTTINLVEEIITKNNKKIKTKY